MKISIVIAEGIKQVMMTPESDHEREALKWISATDKIEIAQRWGAYDSEPTHFSYNTSMCQGGYLRRFAEKDSLMFVITPTKTDKPTEPQPPECNKCTACYRPSGHYGANECSNNKCPCHFHRNLNKSLL